MVSWGTALAEASGGSLVPEAVAGVGRFGLVVASAVAVCGEALRWCWDSTWAVEGCSLRP